MHACRVVFEVFVEINVGFAPGFARRVKNGCKGLKGVARDAEVFVKDYYAQVLDEAWI
jgi:hypothetical protein